MDNLKLAPLPAVKCPVFSGLELEGQIGLPSRSGERTLSGEENRFSFRARTPKVRTGKPA